MRTIALINQKGGVGKTTTAANLGSGLVRLGRKVLLVDVDPQANLSLHLNIDAAKASRSIYDLLLGKAKIQEVIVPTSEPGLEIVPSHIDLCSAELELVNIVGREVLLRDALKHYVDQNPLPPDYVLIDCPPSLGLLSLNALAAAKEVIIPIQAEFFALQGMGKLVEVVKLVQARLNPALRMSGIVICMYRSQTTLAKEVLQEVRSFFGEIVFTSKIRQNIRLAEAPGHGKTIFAYDPNSHGAMDYMELAREVAGEPAVEPVEGSQEVKEPVPETEGEPAVEPEERSQEEKEPARETIGESVNQPRENSQEEPVSQEEEETLSSSLLEESLPTEMEVHRTQVEEIKAAENKETQEKTSPPEGLSQEMSE